MTISSSCHSSAVRVIYLGKSEKKKRKEEVKEREKEEGEKRGKEGKKKNKKV